MSNENKIPNNTPETPKNQDRKTYMAQYYADNKDEISARRKAARLERKNEINAAAKEKYATDHTVREQKIKSVANRRQANRERIAVDPIAKKQHEERLAKRRQRHKERLTTDPAYRQKREYATAAQRERRKQKREGNEP